MNKSADYIIIGGGPGGYELAAAAARTGASVILVERDRLGGTCLNRGCIPTKTYCHAAEIVSSSKSGADYGITVPSAEIDYARLVARKDEVIAQLREGVEIALSKVDVRHDEAGFISPSSIEVNGEILTASKIVIATGSTPATLPIDGADLAVNSDYLLEMTSLPKRMTIIGGGVIGIEFASIYNSLGVEVTVIEYCKEILPPFDKDIAKRLRMALSAAGVIFNVGAEVTSIEPGLKVNFTSKSKQLSVESDLVVMAVGRRPVLPPGLENTGVITDRGRVIVDPETMATNVSGIYAVGDVNGLCMLAHAASAQGRKLLGEKIDLGIVPSAVFSNPEAAMVGLTEEACKTSGRNYRSVKALFRANGKAVSMGETGGMVKLIVDVDSRHILGCHIVGPHAADLVQEVAVIMANGLTVDAVSETIHAHPTLSEIIASAAMMF